MRVWNKKTAWEDKVLGGWLHRSTCLLTGSLGSKRIMPYASNQEPTSASPAHATLPISLANHATCARHLIVRVIRCAIIIAGTDCSRSKAENTIPQCSSRGRISTSYAKYGKYPTTFTPRCHTSMRLPRWLCQQQWDSGIASNWLSLLLWSLESEASFSGRATHRLSVPSLLYRYVAGCTCTPRRPSLHIWWDDGQRPSVLLFSRCRVGDNDVEPMNQEPNGCPRAQDACIALSRRALTLFGACLEASEMAR
jgi:hypothetical protein